MFVILIKRKTNIKFYHLILDQSTHAFLNMNVKHVINNWETGRTIPDIEDLLLYSKITGLSIEDILISY